MSVIRFFRRLVGRDQEALDASQRFRSELARADVTQRRLAEAETSLDTILRDIERKRLELARSVSTSSGISGEHRIEVPPLPKLPEIKNGRDK